MRFPSSFRFLLVGVALLAACESGSGADGLGDGGAGGDADADADADSDSDGDADSETGADSDGDSDSDGDADSDSDADDGGDAGSGAGECVDGDDDGWCVPLDCDDSDDAIYPGAVESETGGIDDDCDGVTDEAPWQLNDNDSDGFNSIDGDCDDYNEYVNPDAIEDLGPAGTGDGVDNDCDGFVDEDSACACDGVGASIDNLVCAMDVCTDSWTGSFLVASALASVSGVSTANLDVATEAVTKFGTPSNLDPLLGGSYALLSSGGATLVNNRSRSLAGSAWTDPWDDADSAYDTVEIQLSLRAPSNALGFSFDYVFFSAEYDDFIGTEYNDKFYVIMNGPSTGGANAIVNFTECRDQSSGGYSDFTDAAACPGHPYGHCCYIAINNSYSECCWYDGCPDGESDFPITGTGFVCAASELADSASNGSSTEWLRTTVVIAPGEEFTLRFHIHDTGDHIYDSEVILDRFQWHTQEVEPGTHPVE